MNERAWPLLGCGVGLRNEHYDFVLSNRPAVDWFEAISENFMDSGGRPIRILEKVRENYPVVLHGTSLSIGSKDDLDPAYLTRLKALVERIQPALVSDHLCWSGIDGHRLHDLLPLPYTEEALNHVVERLTRVQESLGRRILIENVSTYLTYQHSEMTEWKFITEAAKRSGCGLLIDLNNIFVNSFNHQFDSMQFVNYVPGQLVGQIHLAGHTNMGGFLFDTHSASVIDEVWKLYEEALQRWGKVSTLIEWDEHIPEFPKLLNETRKAKVFYEKAGDPPVIERKGIYLKKAGLKLIRGEPTLVETQRWFKSRIHPDKNTSYESGAGVQLNGQRGTPGEERLSVYADGYTARIFEALKEAYGATRHILGDGAFSGLAMDYAKAIPSKEYNLSLAGRHLPEFLKTWPTTSKLPFLTDLAEMEWKITRSFHAFDGPAFDAANLAVLSEADWENLNLKFQPSFAIVSSSWPILDIWNARHTPVKELQVDLKNKPQKIQISRPNGGTEVSCELMSPEAFKLTRNLTEGLTLGDALEITAEDDLNPPVNVQELFQRWVRYGLIADCQLAGEKLSSQKS